MKSFLIDIASRWVDVNSGVPRGLVLSPLMNFIFINGLPEVIARLGKNW